MGKQGRTAFEIRSWNGQTDKYPFVDRRSGRFGLFLGWQPIKRVLFPCALHEVWHGHPQRRGLEAVRLRHNHSIVAAQRMILAEIYDPAVALLKFAVR